MKNSKSNKVDRTEVLKAATAVVVALLPLAGLAFNTKGLWTLFEVDILSGQTLRYALAAVIVSFLGYYIYRVIYTEKDRRKLLRISLNNFFLNLLIIAIFVIGTVAIIPLLPAIQMSDSIGSILALSLVTFALSVFTFEVAIYDNKGKSDASQTYIATYREWRPTAIALHIVLLLISLSLLLIISNGKMQFAFLSDPIAWNLVYIIFIQPTLLPKLVR